MIEGWLVRGCGGRVAASGRGGRRRRGGRSLRGWGGGWLRGLAAGLVVTASVAGCGKAPAGGTGTGAAAGGTKAAVKPAPKPVGELPKGAACVTPACHASYASAAHIHGPVAAKACFACHGGDVGGHEYPLTRSGNEVCTFCHAVVGTKAYQHAATTQPAEPGGSGAGGAAGGVLAKGGGCLNCHDPHVSRAKYLLTADTVEAVCAKCHDVPLKKHAHEPFLEGECTVCHEPHQADNVAFLRGGNGKGGPQHCYMCHAEKREAMTQDRYVHAPAQASCTTCHGPHATEYAYELRKPVNETCLDAKCHPQVKEALAKASVVHGAVLTGEGCANCHDPHASNQPARARGAGGQGVFDLPRQGREGDGRTDTGEHGGSAVGDLPARPGEDGELQRVSRSARGGDAAEPAEGGVSEDFLCAVPGGRLCFVLGMPR